MRVMRFVSAVALLVVVAAAVQPVWATLPTANQPILVVQDSTSSNPYQNFVPEMLTTEGINGFQVAQLGDLTSTFLAHYDVVILPHLTLTSAQATLFRNYVNAGGTLIGFRPDLQLANVFGVASLGTTLPEAWLKIDTTTPYASSLVSNVLRFHGTADLYSLNGASALATLYNSTTSSTTSPAAAINSFGQGQAILFSFDLSQSIALMRQGNPAWAGYPNNHDGFNTMRASGMFMDTNSGQFWNDLGNGTLNDIPQADIQLRLFSNALILTNAAKRPLPKLWYFPNQNRSQLLMTGDDHSFPVADALSEINNIASFGGLFSYNMWYPFTTVSSSQVNTWVAAGDSLGIHFNDTGETDSSGVGGSAASWNGMQSVMTTALSSFASTYPSAPFPVTTRNHFLIWVSNDSNGTADQVAQAKLFQNKGIQLDTSYSSFPNRWGYMTGSGLPMKFLDPVAGSVIPVYEQATQYEDDVQLSTVAYSTNWNISTAQSHYQQSLSDSLNSYNTVITMLFHPENWSNYQSYAQAALQYAKNQAIPISTTGKWLSFWQARAATTVSMPSFTSGTLAFTATGSPAGLTLLVPNTSGNSAVVSTFRVDGTSKSFTVSQYQGVEYASVVLTAGTHSISVGYTTAGSISGQVSPSSVVPSTTIQLAEGGSVMQTVSPNADGTYTLGPLPAGTYTVTPVSSSFTFSPTSQTVTLGTADVTNVNFSANGGSSGQTLFTTQTPTVTNASDGSGVNYELGTAFASDIAGQITAVRFWKASSETGVHTGRIWSSSGQLLTSVTFSNETASGWQQQVLTSPLSIAANTTYVVSVNTGNTFYVATSGGLSSQVVNGDLRSIVGNNGLFGSPGTFPTSSFQGSNYFRDIVFSSGATTTYSVSGAITPSSSGVGSTVTLSLGGTTVTSTTADSNGNYSFTGLADGNYTVTPSKSGFTFSPTSAPANVSNANVTVTTFTATGNSSTETLFTTQTPAVTNASDGSGVNYELGTAFASDIAGQITAVRFWKASSETGVHTGRIWSSSGQLLTSVTFSNETASGWQQQALTSPLSIAANTTYVVSVNTGNTFYVATNGGLSSKVVNGDLSSIVGNNGLYGSTGTFPTNSFQGSNYFRDIVFSPSATYSVSGTITPSSIGAGTTVTLSLSGSTVATTTADSNGNYSFSGLANGNYTVTPAKSSVTFSPTSAAANVSNASISSLNFTATAATFSVSGSITPSASGNGTTVTLTLSGNTVATTTANSSGSYTFTGVTAGNYTVTPTKTGFTFSPTSAPANVTNANVTVTTFTATTVPTFSISGTISPTTSGSGTTVTLIGAATATTSANSSGVYTFTGLAAGSYTVTPTKPGFSFNPVNTTVSITNANVTANFTIQTASIAIDVTKSTDSSNKGQTIASPAFSTASPNELLLAFIATDANNGGANVLVNNVTGGGLTWTLVSRTNVQLGTAEIWRAFAPATLGGVTVTASVSENVSASMTVMSFTGVSTAGTNGSGAIGAIGSGNANPGAPTASLVTTMANSLVIGVGNDWDNAISRTAGPNQSMVHQYLSTSNGDTYWVQRVTTLAPAGTTVVVNDTAPTTDRYNLSICEILP